MVNRRQLVFEKSRIFDQSLTEVKSSFLPRYLDGKLTLQGDSLSGPGDPHRDPGMSQMTDIRLVDLTRGADPDADRILAWK